MSMGRCNILIKGTLSSGSSAVKDLLREYENINTIPGEFDDFRSPGLVADQLSYNSSIDYPNKIDEITRLKSLKWRIIYKSVPKNIWRKNWNNKMLKYFKNKLIRLHQLYLIKYFKHKLERLHQIYIIKYFKRKLARFNQIYLVTFKHKLIRLHQIYFLKELNKSLKSTISFEEKIQFSNIWIQHIGDINSFNKDFVLFDQPLLPCSDINIWTKVFKPFKLICVYRDPKDQLAEMIKRGVLFSPFSSPVMTYTGVNVMSIYGKDRKGMI